VTIYMPALMAFLHHCAAFTLVSALAIEVAIFKQPLSALQARRLQVTDMIFGIAAGVVLVVGLLRVFFFEKGASYYFADGFFHAKLTAFVLAGLISLYPTMLYLSWRPALKAGEAPQIHPARFRRARLCLMLELTLILVILFCAPLMARGFWHFGHS
jgi:putative membrane protein